MQVKVERWLVCGVHLLPSARPRPQPSSGWNWRGPPPPTSHPPTPKRTHWIAVGPPLSATEFRLESVPELNYDAQGSPPKVGGCLDLLVKAVLPNTGVGAGAQLYKCPRVA